MNFYRKISKIIKRLNLTFQRLDLNPYLHGKIICFKSVGRYLKPQGAVDKFAVLHVQYFVDHNLSFEKPLEAWNKFFIAPCGKIQNL